MRIKRFEGKTMKDVMERVKREFGKEAVIVSTETLDGKVIVTAASDYEVGEPKEEKPVTYSPRVIAGKKRRPKPMPAAQVDPELAFLDEEETLPPITDIDSAVEIEYLREELKKQRELMEKRESAFLTELAMLKETLQSILRESLSRSSKYPVALLPYLKKGVEFGIEEDIVSSVLGDLKERDDFFDETGAVRVLKLHFAAKIRVADIFEYFKRGGVFLFAGPTGVGKTTTLLKIATNLVLKNYGSKVALVSVDFVRPDGHVQLKRYSELLNLPFFHVDSVSEYERLIAELRDVYPVVLVDTAGVSPLSSESMDFLKNLGKLKETIPLFHLPVATEYEQALQVYDVFKRALGEFLTVFTKEDEAVRNGLMASISVTRRVRIAAVTDGQRIPEDIVFTRDREKVLDLIFTNKFGRVEDA